MPEYWRMVRDCNSHSLCSRAPFTARTLCACSEPGNCVAVSNPMPITTKIKCPFGHLIFVADGEGFEPPDGLPHQRFSRPPHSTALPTILNFLAVGLSTFGFGPAYDYIILGPHFAGARSQDTHISTHSANHPKLSCRRSFNLRF